MKMKKMVLWTMFLVLMCTGTVRAQDNTVEAEESDSQTPIVVLGADLTDTQREEVLSLLGVSEEDLANDTVLEVTNEEEHKYLDQYLDQNLIGTHALSSCLVIPTEKGSGLQITTKNISFCTISMYQNALITAGMEDASVVVAGPMEISGTAALIGAVKAYATTQDQEIDETALEVATHELVTTGQLGEALDDPEKAADLMAYVKQQVVSKDLKSEDDIRDAITQGAKEMGIDLTDQETDEILDVMNKVSTLDLDADALKTQAKDLFDTLKGMGLDMDTKEAANFFQQLLNAIIEFFQNLFS